MPVIVTPDLRVVNGIGRLELYAEAKAETVPVVEVPAERAALADAMLNLLSMDFDIHTRYADVLRYNSFRRPRGRRNYLGRCFTFDILGSKLSHTFDIKKPADRDRWIRHYGTRALDFGAGLGDETRLLNEAGVECTPFEPFLLDGANEIDRAGAVALTRRFLAKVAEGTRWHSIFLSAIMNSVPFLQDRRHVIAIVASLCGPSTAVHAVSASTGQAGYENVHGKNYVNEKSTLQFKLGYEPRTLLADIGSTPKVQKYHTPQEFGALWGERFASVAISESVNNSEAVCRRPKPVTPAELAAALEFEFDLPYPDGKRMGLVAEAKAAFGKRLGLTL